MTLEVTAVQPSCFWCGLLETVARGTDHSPAAKDRPWRSWLITGNSHFAHASMETSQPSLGLDGIASHGEVGTEAFPQVTEEDMTSHIKLHPIQ